MNARTLIFTGEGKGKTTAALGMALRAAGHNQRVLIVQFLKSNPGTGEIAALAHLPNVKIVQMGLGFVPAPEHPAYGDHQAEARGALAFAREALAPRKYDLVILDEICGAVARGLIDEEPVIELMSAKERTACLVLTGRYATEPLIQYADTVTEMKCIRHGYKEGISAQEGVEF